MQDARLLLLQPELGPGLYFLLNDWTPLEKCLVTLGE